MKVNELMVTEVASCSPQISLQAGDKKISSTETMDFLRHVSAHHPCHKAPAAL